MHHFEIGGQFESNIFLECINTVGMVGACVNVILIPWSHLTSMKLILRVQINLSYTTLYEGLRVPVKTEPDGRTENRTGNAIPPFISDILNLISK